jgi:hypothetical protein
MKDSPSRSVTSGPIVGIKALLDLAQWCQQRQHGHTGEERCPTSRMTESPPAPNVCQSEHSAEGALAERSAIESPKGPPEIESVGAAPIGNASSKSGGAQ